jgi:hypothetical protein
VALAWWVVGITLVAGYFTSLFRAMRGKVGAETGAGYSPAPTSTRRRDLSTSTRSLDPMSHIRRRDVLAAAGRHMSILATQERKSRPHRKDRIIRLA